MRHYESLMDALEDLKRRGYSLDFRREPTCLYCYVFDLWISPDQFNIDEVYRFEGDSNIDDSCVLYAISSYSGMKGVLIDSYGVYAEYLTFEIARRIEVNYL